MQTINGNIYRDMVISAANSIENEKEKINSLNVFPVPDGDTGINMSLTMQSAKKSLEGFSGDLSACADLVANALLRGGRGNSGVILSLFFRGIAKELKGRKEAVTVVMAKALRSGVDSAYKAVRHPTEGTILTVMRMSATVAEQIAGEYADDFAEFFRGVLSQAKLTLAQTPEMLPVLKQANVVDAGGRGLVSIFTGMLFFLDGNGIVVCNSDDQTESEGATFDQFDTQDIKFQYCTECIVDKYPDLKPSIVSSFEDLVMDIGDSNVFVDDSEAGIIKVHVHTNDPGKVLSAAVTCGTLATVKVENMKNQHSNLVIKQTEEKHKETKPVKRAPEKRYGFVSVAAGAGLISVFKDIGVDYIVEGGQTMNPSTDDIIAAVDQTPAEIVFVLPNNKNIYMAAKQAEDLVTDKKVIVIRTTSVPQGISAVLAFNEELDVEQNTAVMIDAVKSVRTAKMTFAARDSVYSDKVIKEGQMLGMVENDVRYVCDSKEECMENLVHDMSDASFITVFYGEDVSDDEASKMSDFIRQKVGNAEISFVNGGQPVYYYIISAE